MGAMKSPLVSFSLSHIHSTLGLSPFKTGYQAALLGSLSIYVAYSPLNPPLSPRHVFHIKLRVFNMLTSLRYDDPMVQVSDRLLPPTALAHTLLIKIQPARKHPATVPHLMLVSLTPFFFPFHLNQSQSHQK
jgi:hypothetical protein